MLTATALTKKNKTSKAAEKDSHMELQAFKNLIKKMERTEGSKHE